MTIEYKPPLGLMPRHVWYDLRLQDIKLAIIRYLEASMMIPKEWVQEYNHILEMKENDQDTQE